MVCRLGRSPVSFVRRRKVWDWGCRRYTAYPVKEVRCPSDHWSIYRHQNERAPPAHSLGHLDKQALAEHTLHYNHAIKSQDTRVLLTVPGFMDGLIRKMVELELHHNIMNREDGLTSSGVWKLLFRLFRDCRRPCQCLWLLYCSFRAPVFILLPTL